MIINNSNNDNTRNNNTNYHRYIYTLIIFIIALLLIVGIVLTIVNLLLSADNDQQQQQQQQQQIINDHIDKLNFLNHQSNHQNNKSLDNQSIMDPFKRAINRRYIGFEQENNEEWKESFRFIQAADTQYGMIHQFETISYNQASYDESRPKIDEYKRSAIGKWDEEMRLTKLAIKQWNQMLPKPKFIVICGDLVNDFPDEPLREKQLSDFRKTFEENLDLTIPLILLPGNHDIYDQPTVDSIEKYRQQFGDDYFAFWVQGVMFLVINAQYYKDNTQTKEMAAHHERWIDAKLQEAKQHNYKHIIVFQHVPWFIHDPNEPDDEIFNIAIDERLRMLKKFNDNGVRAIFCGHYHRNAGGHYEDMEIIVTSAMGAQIPATDSREIDTKSGYRIVDVDENEIKHRYVEIES